MEQVVRLQDLCPTGWWKIFYDASHYHAPKADKDQYQELRGVDDTRIYVHSEDGHTLAVSTENPYRYRALRKAFPFATSKNGCVLLFPARDLPAVAKAIRAKRARKTVTPEQAVAFRARMVAHGMQKNVPACIG